MLALVVSGCTAGATPSAREALSATVTASISAFDKAGGSETTLAADGQYALIFDPSAPTGHQVVTADLADSTSPAFGDVSAIAIHSMKTLVDSEEFQAATVDEADGTYTVTGTGFGAEIHTQDGLITQVKLDAGSEDSASQVVLITYGITPEAKKIFDSAG
jgi:hypothetical protein